MVGFNVTVYERTVVEVEEEGAHVFVVDLPAAVRLVLRDHLAAVLGDELVLVGGFLQEDAPARHVGRSQQQVLVETSIQDTSL